MNSINYQLWRNTQKCFDNRYNAKPRKKRTQKINKNKKSSFNTAKKDIDRKKESHTFLSLQLGRLPMGLSTHHTYNEKLKTNYKGRAFIGFQEGKRSCEMKALHPTVAPVEDEALRRPANRRQLLHCRRRRARIHGSR